MTLELKLMERDQLEQAEYDVLEAAGLDFYIGRHDELDYEIEQELRR